MPNWVISILIGAPVAILGAFAAYHFGKWRSAAERQLLTRSIATALLADLRIMESLLRQLAHNEQPGNWRGDPPLLFYDQIRRDVMVGLSPSTLQVVTEVFGQAHDMFGVIAQSPPKGVLDQYHYRIRVAAVFTLQAISPAVSALVSEGGTMPDPRYLEVVHSPDIPTIPPRSFPDFPATPGEDLPDHLM